ncbi:Protein of unknown function [Gryllus bimaculatus]|nr:Protein of unknown function [Gryllus bimaculatus]
MLRWLRNPQRTGLAGPRAHAPRRTWTGHCGRLHSRTNLMTEGSCSGARRRRLAAITDYALRLHLDSESFQERHKQRETNRERHKQRETQRGTQTERDTNRERHKQRETQTERDTERDTNRERQTEPAADLLVGLAIFPPPVIFRSGATPQAK